MAEHRNRNLLRSERVQTLQDKVRNTLGNGPSMIETPEEARKVALLQKVRDAG